MGLKTVLLRIIVSICAMKILAKKMLSFVALWFLVLVKGGGSASVLLLFILLLSVSWRSLASGSGSGSETLFSSSSFVSSALTSISSMSRRSSLEVVEGQGSLFRLALFLTFSLPFYQDGQARPRFRYYPMHLFSCRFRGQERLYKRRSPPITQNKFFKRKLSKPTRRIPKAP